MLVALRVRHTVSTPLLARSIKVWRPFSTRSTRQNNLLAVGHPTTCFETDLDDILECRSGRLASGIRQVSEDQNDPVTTLVVYSNADHQLLEKSIQSTRKSIQNALFLGPVDNCKEWFPDVARLESLGLHEHTYILGFSMSEHDGTRESEAASLKVANRVAHWIGVRDPTKAHPEEDHPPRPPTRSLVNAIISRHAVPDGFVMGIATGGFKRPLGAAIVES